MSIRFLLAGLGIVRRGLLDSARRRARESRQVHYADRHQWQRYYCGLVTYPSLLIVESCIVIAPPAADVQGHLRDDWVGRRGGQ